MKLLYFNTIIIILILTFSSLSHSFATNRFEPVILDNNINFEDRRAQLLEWADVKYKVSDHRISKVYWMLGDTARNGCNAEYSNHIVDFVNYIESDDKEFAFFVLPAIVRYLYQFENCLSSQNIEVLKTYVSEGIACEKFNYLGHGTLNHAIIQASSWYLLVQYFSEQIWMNHDGINYSNQELLSLLHAKLISRFEKHSAKGHIEIASPNYLEINFFPLVNLIDFSDNSLIREMAEEEAIKSLLYLKTYSFKGKLIPPLTRQVSNELNSSITGFESFSYRLGLDKRLFWYYFGADIELTVDDFRNGRSPMFWIIYALSDWFPATLMDEENNITDRLTYNEIPRFSIWGSDSVTQIFSNSYIGSKYAISSANIRFLPYWYDGEIVEFGIVVDSDNIFNQIDCTQPYWNSNTSQFIDNEFKNRWYDRSSPFMQTHLIDKNNMLFIADIPKTDPYTQFENNFTESRSSNIASLAQIVRCRIPNGFDNIKLESNKIVVNETNIVIQIHSLSQNFEYENDEHYTYFSLNGGKSAMHFFVTDESLTPQELQTTLSQFNIEYDNVNSEIMFEQVSNNTKVKMTFRNVLINDSDSPREQMYESIPLIEYLE